MKTIVAWLGYNLGLITLALWIESKLASRHQIIVLAYHHISTDAEQGLAISDLEHGTPLRVLETQLATLCRWYDPISVEELGEVLSGSKRLSSDRLLVTFDDGYRDNLTVAGSCLQRHQIPGLVFLPTGFIDSAREFWWARLAEMLRSTNREAQRVCAADESVPASVRGILADADLSHSGGRRAAWLRIAPLFVNFAEAERETVLNRLDSLLPSSRNQLLKLVSWDDVRCMARQGFHFGGHTHNHLLLTQITEQQIRDELQTCHRIIQAETGRAPISFAYPSGAHDDQSLREMRQGPFPLAFITQCGTIDPMDCDRSALRRIYLWQDRPYEIASIALMLKLGKYLKIAMSAACRIIRGY